MTQHMAGQHILSWYVLPQPVMIAYLRPTTGHSTTKGHTRVAYCDQQVISQTDHALAARGPVVQEPANRHPVSCHQAIHCPMVSQVPFIARVALVPGPGMGMQQPYYGQQLQQQPGGWSQPPMGGMPPPDGSSLPPPLNPGAPADAETLKRLKEELLQQKQQTAPGRFAAAAAAAGGGGAGGGSGGASSSAGGAKKAVMREAAGRRWVDPTLAEWPENDFRIFVGDLGNEVNDEALSKAFSRYPSFAKAKVRGWGRAGAVQRLVLRAGLSLLCLPDAGRLIRSAQVLLLVPIPTTSPSVAA